LDLMVFPILFTLSWFFFTSFLLFIHLIANTKWLHWNSISFLYDWSWCSSCLLFFLFVVLGWTRASHMQGRHSTTRAMGQASRSICCIFNSFFWMVLGFELRVLCLLGWHSMTWVECHQPFLCWIFF
jgi:hypothetical protein